MEHPQVSELRKKFGISPPVSSQLSHWAQQQQHQHTAILDASLTGMNSSTASDRTNRTTSTTTAGSPATHGGTFPLTTEPVRENSNSFQSPPSTTPPSPSATNRPAVVNQPPHQEMLQRQEVMMAEIDNLTTDQIYVFAKETFLLLNQIGTVSSSTVAPVSYSGVNLPPMMRSARGGANSVDSPRGGAQLGLVRSRQSSLPSTVALSQEASHDDMNFTGLHSRRESSNPTVPNQPSNHVESGATATNQATDLPSQQEENSASTRSATMPPSASPPAMVELEIESASPRVLSSETLPPATSTHKDSQSRTQSELPSPSAECVSTSASTPGASAALLVGATKKDGSGSGRLDREDSLMSTNQGSDGRLGVSKAATLKSSTSHSSLVSYGAQSSNHLAGPDIFKTNQRLASETASSQGESPRKSLVNSQSPQGQSPPNFMVEGPSGTPHGVTIGQGHLMVMQNNFPKSESHMLLDEIDPDSSEQPMSYMQSMRMNPKAVETQDGFFDSVNEYLMIEEVGRGSYASVFKAAQIDQETGETKREVAIKRIPKSVFRRGRGDLSPGVSPAVTPAMKGLGVGIAGAPPASLALDGDSSKTPSASVSATHLAPPVRKVMSNPNSAIQSGGILREIAVMKKVKHENVMHLLECIYDPTKAFVYLIMPFAEGGPVLKQGLVNHQYEPIKEVTALSYLKQVTRGLTFLHKHEIVHFDLKPDNILRRNDRLYIADFGMSNLVSVVNDPTGNSNAQLSEQDLVNQRFANLMGMGTPAFHCPEVGFMQLRGEVLTREQVESVKDTLTLTKDYDVKVVDIWALGVTFYLMLTGVLPFTKDPRFDSDDPDLIAEQETLLDANDKKTYFLKYMQRIVTEDISLPKYYKMSNKTRALVQKMLHRDPRKRCSAESILSNKLFRKRHQQHLTEAKKLSGGIEVTPSPEPEGTKTNNSQSTTNDVSPVAPEVIPEVQLPKALTQSDSTKDRSPEMEGPTPLKVPPLKPGARREEDSEFTTTSGSGGTDEHPLLTEVEPGLLSSSEPNTPGGQLLLSNDSIILSGDEYSPGEPDGEHGTVPDWLSPKSMRAVDRSILKIDKDMFNPTDEEINEAVVTVNPSASIPRNFSSSAVFGAMMGLPSAGNSPLPGNSPSNQSNILPVHQSGLTSLGGSSTALLAKPYIAGIEPPQRRRASIPAKKV